MVADFPHFSDFHGDFLRWFSLTLAETLTPHAAASLPGQNLRQDASCKKGLFWLHWYLLLLDESRFALCVEIHRILKLLEVYFANLRCQFIVGVGTVIDINILTSNQWSCIRLFTLHTLSIHFSPCYLMSKNLLSVLSTALLLRCCNCTFRASKQWLISLSHSQSGEQCVTWNHFRELDNWQQPSVIDQKGDWDLALFKMCILAFSHPCFVSQDYSDLQKSMSTQIRLKYNACNIVCTCTDVWDKSRVQWQLIKAAANPRLLAAKLAHLIPLVAKLIKLDVRFIKFPQNIFTCNIFISLVYFSLRLFAFLSLHNESIWKQGPPIRLINIFLIQLINSRRKWKITLGATRSRCDTMERSTTAEQVAYVSHHQCPVSHQLYVVSHQLCPFNVVSHQLSVCTINVVSVVAKFVVPQRICVQLMWCPTMWTPINYVFDQNCVQYKLCVSKASWLELCSSYTWCWQSILCLVHAFDSQYHDKI